jgi:hypothetical protein
MQLYCLREHPGKPVMGNNKTVVSNTPVEEFVAGIDDEKKRRDSSEMIALMRKITGHEPRLWGSSLVGFGSYHYRYESGREGDFFLTGFSPRKSAFTVYIMPGFERCAALLKKLGPHKTGKSCLYLKNLAAVDRGVLEEIIRDSVEYMREKYPGT